MFKLKKMLIAVCLCAALLTSGCASGALSAIALPAAGAAALPSPSPSEIAKAQSVGVNSFSGSLGITSDGEELKPYEGMRLAAGSTVETGKKSSATIDLDKGKLITMDENTKIELSDLTQSNMLVTLLSGNIVNNIPKGAGKYSVRAANVTMGVMGTVFHTSFDGVTPTVRLFEGSVELALTSEDGATSSFMLESGRMFTASPENINQSIQKGALETAPIDLEGLSTPSLIEIASALEEREGADDMLKQVRSRIPERNVSSAPVPAPVESAQPVTSATTTPTPSPSVAPQLDADDDDEDQDDLDDEGGDNNDNALPAPPPKPAMPQPGELRRDMSFTNATASPVGNSSKFSVDLEWNDVQSFGYKYSYSDYVPGGVLNGQRVSGESYAGNKVSWVIEVKGDKSIIIFPDGDVIAGDTVNIVDGTPSVTSTSDSSGNLELHLAFDSRTQSYNYLSSKGGTSLTPSVQDNGQSPATVTASFDSPYNSVYLDPAQSSYFDNSQPENKTLYYYKSFTYNVPASNSSGNGNNGNG